MSGILLPTLSKKKEVDSIIRDTLDKLLVLRFGRPSDPICLQLDDILFKTSHEVSKFTAIALVDIDSEEIQVYVKYFDISLIPSTIFFFNAHHMKMDSGTADHTKWVGSFHRKQDFIDVVEAIYRGAMKGKLIVSCPLPPERIPKFQLLFKNLRKERTIFTFLCYFDSKFSSASVNWLVAKMLHPFTSAFWNQTSADAYLGATEGTLEHVEVVMRLVSVLPGFGMPTNV